MLAHLDTTKGVSSSRQQDGGHGSRNPLRSEHVNNGHIYLFILLHAPVAYSMKGEAASSGSGVGGDSCGEGGLL